VGARADLGRGRWSSRVGASARRGRQAPRPGLNLDGVRRAIWRGWSSLLRPAHRFARLRYGGSAAPGTITWTSPTGRTYTTHAGSRLLFPTLCLPTGELPAIPTAYRPPGDRDIMMPTRRRTRQQDRAHRINAERALNAAHIAERNQPPPF